MSERVSEHQLLQLRAESLRPIQTAWMQQPTRWTPQTSADSAAVASLPCRKKKDITSLRVDSRKPPTPIFEFDVGETVHLQGSTRLQDQNGGHLPQHGPRHLPQWRNTALGTLNWVQLPTGRAPACAWPPGSAATYVESRNELEMAHDCILNDQELRLQFPGSGSFPGTGAGRVRGAASYSK